MKTKILVGSVETKDYSGAIKCAIQDQETKLYYGFFQKRKDGAQSKAQEGFIKLRPIAGDTIFAETEEKPGTNTVTGKPTVYRNILWFYTDGKELEASQTQQNAPTSVPTGKDDKRDYGVEYEYLNARIDKMADVFKALEKRVGGLETVSYKENGEEATKLHQSFAVRDIHEAKSIVEDGTPVIGKEYDGLPEGFDR